MTVLKRTVMLICAIVIAVTCIPFQQVQADEKISEVIRVAFTPDMPPYQYFDGENYVGLNIDLFDAIVSSIGFEVEYFPMTSVAECMKAVENQECDVILGLPEQDLTGFVQMKDAIVSSSISMLIRKETYTKLKSGESNLIQSAVYENKTVPSLTLFNRIRISEAYAKNFNRISVSSQKSAFELYLEGNADALLGDQQSIRFLLRQNHLSDQHLIYYNQLSDVSYSVFACDKNASILTDIQLGLLEIRNNGVYAVIQDKWIDSYSDNDDITLLGMLKKFWNYVVVFLSIVFAIIIAIVLINRFLREQISIKTGELRKANSELENYIERSQYESNLRSLMIEKNPCGIVLLNQDGYIQQCNRAARQIFTIEQDVSLCKLVDYPLGSLITEGKELFTPHAQKYLDCQISYGAENSERIYQYSLIPMSTSKENRGALLIINDITARLKEAHNIAEADKNRILNLMVAAIAHEIRNPLMVIKTSAQLLKIRKDRQADLIKEYADIIPDEVDHINRLVEDLINYTKKSPVCDQIIDLREMVVFCIRFLSPTIQKSYIQIRSEIEGNLVVKGSSDQFKQILINILLNATQAIETKANSLPHNTVLHIDINAYRSDNSVFIKIRDEGCGMDEDTIKQVTNPFYTTKGSGFGLGMAITKKYVEDNRGKISFSSELGVHTIVTLEFPGEKYI